MESGAHASRYRAGDEALIDRSRVVPKGSVRSGLLDPRSFSGFRIGRRPAFDLKPTIVRTIPIPRGTSPGLHGPSIASPPNSYDLRFQVPLRFPP